MSTKFSDSALMRLEGSGTHSLVSPGATSVHSKGVGPGRTSAKGMARINSNVCYLDNLVRDGA